MFASLNIQLTLIIFNIFYQCLQCLDGTTNAYSIKSDIVYNKPLRNHILKKYNSTVMPINNKLNPAIIMKSTKTQILLVNNTTDTIIIPTTKIQNNTTKNEKIMNNTLATTTNITNNKRINKLTTISTTNKISVIKYPGQMNLTSSTTTKNKFTKDLLAQQNKLESERGTTMESTFTHGEQVEYVAIYFDEAERNLTNKNLRLQYLNDMMRTRFVSIFGLIFGNFMVMFAFVMIMRLVNNYRHANVYQELSLYEPVYED